MNCGRRLPPANILPHVESTIYKYEDIFVNGDVSACHYVICSVQQCYAALWTALRSAPLVAAKILIDLVRAVRPIGIGLPETIGEYIFFISP